MGAVSEELYVGWSEAGDVSVSIILGVEVLDVEIGRRCMGVSGGGAVQISFKCKYSLRC